MVYKANELLSPITLSRILKTKSHRRDHRKRIEAAGLSVPLCLMNMMGQTETMKDQIRAAIAETHREAAKLVGSARSRQRTRKAEAEKAERLAYLIAANAEGVKRELDEMPAIPPEGISTLDGPRVGEKEKKGGGENSGTERIDFEVLPSMVEFFEDMSSDTWLLIGPAGSGKTSHAIMKILKHCSLHPNGARYVLLRLTLPQLRDTTVKTFFDWVPRSMGKWNEEAKLFTLGGKYEFFFRAIERPEDVDNVKGLEYTGYFVNEALEVPQEIKRMLDQRCGRYPKEPYFDEETKTWRKRGTDKTLRILDTNPPDMEHWLVEEFINKPLPNHRHVFNPPFENAHNLPPGYYERMKDDYRDSPDLYDRYVLGKLGSTYRGKAVFPEWSTATHMARQPLKWMEGVPVLVGLDFGHTPCAVYTQVWPNGCWVILAELLGDNVGISEFSGSMIAFQNVNFPNAAFSYYADPAGAKKAETDYVSPFDILRKKGIFPTPGAVNLPVRLDSVKQRLRLRDGLLVSPTCRRVIDGFAGSYCFKQVGTTGVFTNEPVKNKWSHPQDALQYIATCLFRSRRHEDMDEMIERYTYRPIDPLVGY